MHVSDANFMKCMILYLMVVLISSAFTGCKGHVKCSQYFLFVSDRCVFMKGLQNVPEMVATFKISLIVEVNDNV